MFSYADTLRGYVIPRVGSLRLVDLTATRLRALYAELLESGSRRGTGGLSARTVGYTHRIVSHTLKDAMRAGLLARNPAAIVNPPRATKPEAKTWTAEQVAAFLQHVDSDRLRALWVLLATTGMRRGEALGLKWNDVDVKAGRVTIRRALVLAGYEVVESLPKTAAGNRVVFLHPQTTATLREHRRAQNEERLAAGPAWSDFEFVFTDEIGGSLHPDRVTKLFVQHAREASLPKIRLHDLRHTVATLALTAGVHTKVVQELLGHANVRDHSRHVLPRRARAPRASSPRDRWAGVRGALALQLTPVMHDDVRAAPRTASNSASATRNESVHTSTSRRLGLRAHTHL